MPSISATSVPGRIGCQTAAISAGRSSRRGPIRWNSDPAIAGGAQLLARDVPACAAAADIVVFQRHAAKGQHQGALRYQLGPADVVAGDRPLRADDMRQDHRRGTRAVAADRADIAARQVQKSVDLALRVVKASGAGPAVGPAEDRAWAVACVDAPQFRRDEVERLGPRNRHELVAASPVIGSRTALQPAAADHRPGDPRRVRNRGRDVAQQSRRIRVFRMGNDLDAVSAQQHREGAPVRAVRPASGGPGRGLCGAHPKELYLVQGVMSRGASGRGYGVGDIAMLPWQPWLARRSSLTAGKKRVFSLAKTALDI